jgi:hypothetical protein
MLTGDDLLNAVKNLPSHIEKKNNNNTDFSQKQSVDIAQTLYIEWMGKLDNLPVTEGMEEGRRMVFKFHAECAFEAAEEFAKVFRNQGDN